MNQPLESHQFPSLEYSLSNSKTLGEPFLSEAVNSGRVVCNSGGNLGTPVPNGRKKVHCLEFGSPVFDVIKCNRHSTHECSLHKSTPDVQPQPLKKQLRRKELVEENKEELKVYSQNLIPQESQPQQALPLCPQQNPLMENIPPRAFQELGAAEGSSEATNLSKGSFILGKKKREFELFMLRNKELIDANYLSISEERKGPYHPQSKKLFAFYLYRENEKKRLIAQGKVQDGERILPENLDSYYNANHQSYHKRHPRKKLILNNLGNSYPKNGTTQFENRIIGSTHPNPNTPTPLNNLTNPIVQNGCTSSCGSKSIPQFTYENPKYDNAFYHQARIDQMRDLLQRYPQPNSQYGQYLENHQTNVATQRFQMRIPNQLKHSLSTTNIYHNSENEFNELQHFQQFRQINPTPQYVLSPSASGEQMGGYEPIGMKLPSRRPVNNGHQPLPMEMVQINNWKNKIDENYIYSGYINQKQFMPNYSQNSIIQSESMNNATRLEHLPQTKLDLMLNVLQDIKSKAYEKKKYINQIKRTILKMQAQMEEAHSQFLTQSLENKSKILDEQAKSVKDADKNENPTSPETKTKEPFQQLIIKKEEIIPDHPPSKKLKKQKSTKTKPKEKIKKFRKKLYQENKEDDKFPTVSGKRPPEEISKLSKRISRRRPIKMKKKNKIGNASFENSKEASMEDKRQERTIDNFETPEKTEILFCEENDLRPNLELIQIENWELDQDNLEFRLNLMENFFNYKADQYIGLGVDEHCKLSEMLNILDTNNQRYFEEICEKNGISKSLADEKKFKHHPPSYKVQKNLKSNPWEFWGTSIEVYMRLIDHSEINFLSKLYSSEDSKEKEETIESHSNKECQNYTPNFNRHVENKSLSTSQLEKPHKMSTFYSRDFFSSRKKSKDLSLGSDYSNCNGKCYRYNSYFSHLEKYNILVLEKIYWIMVIKFLQLGFGDKFSKLANSTERRNLMKSAAMNRISNCINGGLSNKDRVFLEKRTFSPSRIHQNWSEGEERESKIKSTFGQYNKKKSIRFNEYKDLSTKKRFPKLENEGKKNGEEGNLSYFNKQITDFDISRVISQVSKYYQIDISSDLNELFRQTIQEFNPINHCSNLQRDPAASTDDKTKEMEDIKINEDEQLDNYNSEERSLKIILSEEDISNISQREISENISANSNIDQFQTPTCRKPSQEETTQKRISIGSSDSAKSAGNCSYSAVVEISCTEGDSINLQPSPKENFESRDELSIATSMLEIALLETMEENKLGVNNLVNEIEKAQTAESALRNKILELDEAQIAYKGTISEMKSKSKKMKEKEAKAMKQNKNEKERHLRRHHSIRKDKQFQKPKNKNAKFSKSKIGKSIPKIQQELLKENVLATESKYAEKKLPAEKSIIENYFESKESVEFKELETEELKEQDEEKCCEAKSQNNDIQYPLEYDEDHEFNLQDYGNFDNHNSNRYYYLRSEEKEKLKKKELIVTIPLLSPSSSLEEESNLSKIEDESENSDCIPTKKYQSDSVLPMLRDSLFSSKYSMDESNKTNEETESNNPFDTLLKSLEVDTSDILNDKEILEVKTSLSNKIKDPLQIRDNLIIIPSILRSSI